MWCWFFAGLSALFLSTTVIFIVSARNEIQRRDEQWREALQIERRNIHASNNEYQKSRTKIHELELKIKLLERKNSNLEVQIENSRVEKQVVIQETTKEECAICFEDAQLLACIPCGHQTTCALCVKYMDRTICPVCRAPGQFYKIYKSAANDAEQKVEKDLPPHEIVKRKGLIRRFIDNLKTSAK